MKDEPVNSKSLNELLNTNGETIEKLRDEVQTLRDKLQPLSVEWSEDTMTTPRDEVNVGYDIGNALVEQTRKIGDIITQIRTLRDRLSI